MLIFSFLACDPGFRDTVDVTVSAEVAEAYTPEASGFLFLEGGSFMTEAIGRVCGGGMDLAYHFERQELGCGSADMPITAWISDRDAIEIEEEALADLPCGVWTEARVPPVELTGDEPSAEGIFEGQKGNGQCGDFADVELRIE